MGNVTNTCSEKKDIQLLTLLKDDSVFNLKAILQGKAYTVRDDSVNRCSTSPMWSNALQKYLSFKKEDHPW